MEKDPGIFIRIILTATDAQNDILRPLVERSVRYSAKGVLGGVVISQGTIARETKRCRATINRALAEWNRKGIIEITPLGRQLVREYILNPLFFDEEVIPYICDLFPALTKEVSI